MTDIITESFKINLRYLQACGLYHTQKFGKLFKLKAILLYFFLNIGLLSLGYIRLVQEPQTIIRTITPSFLADCTSFTYKFAAFIINNRRIRKCVNFFSHSYFLPKSTPQKKIIMDCVEHCQKVNLVYCAGVSGAMAFSLIPGLYTSGFLLPVEIWLPYDYTNSSWVYYLTYFAIIFAVFYNELSGGLIDPLLGGLAYHATSQLRILKCNLQDIKQHKKPEDAVSNLKKVKRCVHHHNIVLSFINEYQECFSTVIFSQLVGTIACTGTLVFSMTLFPPGSVGALSCLGGAFCVVFQFFIHSYYGQLLLEETHSLMDAIYLGKWYTYDIYTQKSLSIIMERAKIPVILTAGKVWNLTLENFMKMLKMIYSVVALLQRIN